MAIGPYVKVNPSEKPSEYLARVQSAGSDGGEKITREEAQEGQALFAIWKKEKFARLTSLPKNNVLKETKALEKIDKMLLRASLNQPNIPMVFGMSGFDVIQATLMSLGIIVGLVYVGWHLWAAGHTEELYLQPDSGGLEK